MFVAVIHFYPSLIFATKAGVESNKRLYDAALCLKFLAKPRAYTTCSTFEMSTENFFSDKHSSLLFVMTNKYKGRGRYLLTNFVKVFPI